MPIIQYVKDSSAPRPGGDEKGQWPGIVAGWCVDRVPVHD